MRFLLPIFILFFFSSAAQYIKRDSTSVDSLKQVYLSYPKEDSIKINHLVNYLFSNEVKLSTYDSTLIAKTLPLSEKLGFTKGTISLYEMYARYFNQKSNYSETIRWALKGDSLASLAEDKIRLLRIKSLIIEVAFTQRDFPAALKKAEEILELVRFEPRSVDFARHYFMLGKCYGANKMYDQALAAYQEAKNISLEFDFAPGISISESSIADTYISLKEYKKALPLLLKNHQLFEPEGVSTNLAASHATLSRCYLGLKKNQKALNHAKLALSFYQKLNFNAYLKDTYLHVGKAYLVNGDIENSSAYIDSAFMIVDSINNLERISTIESLKTKYKTNQIAKEKELALAKNDILEKEKIQDKKEKEASRKIITITIISLIILAGLLWFAINRWLLSRKQKKELDIAYEKLEEQKELELAASNLKAIKSQMNPHFIFNSINSIQDSILQQDTLKSYDHLVVFSKLVRTVLDHSEKEFIPLSEEVSFLNTYLGIEKVRFDNEFDFEIKNEIESESLLIPSLILQPFAENAIKHGLLHKPGKKLLHIYISQRDNHSVYCEIKDNGIGLESAKKLNKTRSNHRSFSTNAIKKRLELLSNHTKQKASFEIESIVNDLGDTEGTLVKVILPFKAVR